MKRILTFPVIFFWYSLAFSQTHTVQGLPRNYFRNPLDLPMEIVANMGELRPNHWHMGLDIRTNQKENQMVYAAASGYIAHIGIRPQSFGRYIIINHPNGLSTLYAHLNDFFPELEYYVTEQQYKQESWAIELDFSKNQFPVARDQFIAYSGNTGGSQGPHLHFEIFDTKSEKRLNPLLFGFPLRDDVAPTFVKLAIYDRSKSLYEQSPQLFALKKTDSGYIIPKQPVIKTGIKKLSFGIQAYDRITGSSNIDGIYSATLYYDELPQVRFLIDSIDYDETSYMNAQIDYKYRYNGGAFLQHLSRLPGDNGGVYRATKNEGVVAFDDTLTHAVWIEIADAYNNISELRFLIQYSDSLAKSVDSYMTDPPFAPNEVNVLEKPGFEVYLPEGCLYDSFSPIYYRNIAPSSSFSLSERHQLNTEAIPLHGQMAVRIKPNKEIPKEWRDKLVIQRTGRRTEVKKAEMQRGWVSAEFGDFGAFQVFADPEPPSINAPGRGDTINLSPVSRILFTPTDNFAVKKFKAELNGQWLRFTNDKGRNWIYKFDERCPYGTHHLKVTVEDAVGNSTTREWWFKRGPYTPPKKKVAKKSSRKKVSSKKKTGKKKSP